MDESMTSPKICALCSNPVCARELCRTHYDQANYRGVLSVKRSSSNARKPRRSLKNVIAASVNHGMSATKVYRSWLQMIHRCFNPNHCHFERYGGRGITTTSDWLDFNNFFRDMGHPPTGGHSLDRLDNNKSYSKNNCRWATPIEQANNRSSNRRITYQGETLTLAEWSRKQNISPRLISRRLQDGWTAERILATPAQSHK
jgi:hypothetical protein